MDHSNTDMLWIHVAADVSAVQYGHYGVFVSILYVVVELVEGVAWLWCNFLSGCWTGDKMWESKGALKAWRNFWLVPQSTDFSAAWYLLVVLLLCFAWVHVAQCLRFWDKLSPARSQFTGVLLHVLLLSPLSVLSVHSVQLSISSRLGGQPSPLPNHTSF